jgi:hypothetical protein
MNERILLAPAGWEERFEKGVYIDIEEFQPAKVLVPFSNEYAARTLRFRNNIRAQAEASNKQYIEFDLDYYEPISVYKALLTIFENHVPPTAKVRFNGTTTPRDLIWYALHLLSVNQIPTEFSYFRPLDYGKTYLSRDARAPRLVLKRSGIAYPDQPTCILAFPGFDEERLSQLEQRYEPKRILIGYQIGNQLDNKKRNVLNRREPVDGESHFEIDCYDMSNKSITMLLKKLDELSEPHNVIAASLGPKPSAVTLFRLTQLRPEIGLAYIPAGDYSEDYSNGIDLTNRTLTEVSWNVL